MEILRSPREIAQLRKAGLLVWEAHGVARALLRPGVTTAEIDAAVECYFAEHHAEPLFKGVPGPVPFPAGFVVKNGSKIRERTSGVIPVPVSDTESST